MREVREVLTRERVVRAAVAVADDEGIGALTVRAVAARLGAAPMSLYHHVAGKEALLDAIVDAAFAETVLPEPGAPWRPQLEARCASLRSVLLRHPWAPGLLDSRRHPGPATLRHHDAVVGVLLEDGFAPVAAAHAYALVDAYVLGFALQENALPFAPQDAAATAEAMLAEAAADPVGPAPYPHLARLAAEVVLRPGYAFGAEFAVGLAVVLDGVAGLRG